VAQYCHFVGVRPLPYYDVVTLALASTTTSQRLWADRAGGGGLGRPVGGGNRSQKGKSTLRNARARASAVKIAAGNADGGWRWRRLRKGGVAATAPAALLALTWLQPPPPYWSSEKRLKNVSLAYQPLSDIPQSSCFFAKRHSLIPSIRQKARHKDAQAAL